MAIDKLIPALEWNPTTQICEIIEDEFTLQNISDTSDIEIGMAAHGTGIPYLSLVTGKTADSVTLDKAITSGIVGRTNDFTFTEDFSQSYWSKIRATIEDSFYPAPDGSLNARRMVSDSTAANSHYISHSMDFVSGETYTFSAYAKKDTINYMRVSLPSGQFAGTSPTYFNLNLGTINVLGTATEATIEEDADYPGWFRCSVSAVCTSTASGLAQILLSETGSSSTFNGTGLQAIYIFGLQLEAKNYGPNLSPYIPSVQSFTSRATIGSYYNNLGVLSWAAINGARMNYNPAILLAPPKLLLEAAATNLILRSQELDNASWTKVRVTVSGNTVSSPEGSVNADTWIEDTSNNTHYLEQSVTIVSGTQYTFSGFVKGAGTARGMFVSFTTGFNAEQAYIDPTNGLISLRNQTPLIRIVSVGNGWYRWSVTATATGTGAFLVRIYSTPTYQGTDTYLGTTSNIAYMYGLQFEAGAFASSYIATAGTTASRSADVASSTSGARAADTASIGFWNRYDFEYPPTKDSDNQIDPQEKVTTSLSGIRQVQIDYMEEKRDLEFGFISSTDHLLLREDFYIPWAVYGNEFRYYPDGADDNYEVYELSDFKFSPKRQVKKHPSFLYGLALKLRRVL